MSNDGAAQAGSVRAFVMAWLGQMVSLIGSGLTRFALGVWVYERTGSVSLFALILLFGILPGILVSPVAGTLVDRWNRRTVMLLADSGSALSVLVLFLLHVTGRLELWHIYAAVAVSSTMESFQAPAYTAAITQLIPRRHHTRASGMVNFAQAAGDILAPLLGGMLVVTIGIGGVMLVDAATFVFAVAMLAWVRFPDIPRAAAGAARAPFAQEVLYGWRYIAARGGLLGLLLVYASINLFAGMAYASMTPMILEFASPAALGMILGAGGAGMLAGSVVMMTWGGPKRRVRGILAFGVLLGFCVVLTGLRPSVALVAAAVFGMNFTLPFIGGCDVAIWLAKTPPDVQGRVFATRRMVALSSIPIAYLAAGPLAERVFKPLLVPGGPLAESLGPVWGVGPGRGLGVLFAAVGVAVMLLASLSWLLPRIRNVEEELADATLPAPAEPAAVVGEGAPAPA
ncbi:MAG TPA: MFS transporter [Armatimonadota bacterium]|nr:MFS transporter [Armatimonadota bacterium]